MSNPRIAEYCKPEHRFPNHRQNHTKKGKYFKPAFEKLLREKYPMQLPNGELANMQGGPGIALAMIWEALRGDVAAAREIMDRVDGKAEQKLVGEGFGETKIILIKSSSNERVAI
jgi:hypothetical protein